MDLSRVRQPEQVRLGLARPLIGLLAGCGGYSSSTLSILANNYDNYYGHNNYHNYYDHYDHNNDWAGEHVELKNLPQPLLWKIMGPETQSKGVPSRQGPAREGTFRPYGLPFRLAVSARCHRHSGLTGLTRCPGIQFSPQVSRSANKFST